MADHSEASPIGLSEGPNRLYEGYIFDLDGTVYLGDVLLPGAERLIRKLRELDRRIVFLSNNPTGDPQMYTVLFIRLKDLAVWFTHADYTHPLTHN